MHRSESYVKELGKNVHKTPVLLTIDVQRGFDHPALGRRNQPQAEEQIAILQAAFRGKGYPLIHVQHLSLKPKSPLWRGGPGAEFKSETAPRPGEAIITKHVNSAFIGTDLECRLHALGAHPLVVVGLTTCHCVSTTIRMAANLGFDVVAVGDAMAQFDIRTPDGAVIAAETAHAVELAALHIEFARVLSTNQILNTVLG